MDGRARSILFRVAAGKRNLPVFLKAVRPGQDFTANMFFGRGGEDCTTKRIGLRLGRCHSAVLMLLRPLCASHGVAVGQPEQRPDARQHPYIPFFPSESNGAQGFFFLGNVNMFSGLAFDGDNVWSANFWV